VLRWVTNADSEFRGWATKAGPPRDSRASTIGVAHVREKKSNNFNKNLLNKSPQSRVGLIFDHGIGIRVNTHLDSWAQIMVP